MRIGIDYRLLSAGRMTIHRGRGRYTQQQLREVLRLDSRSEYVLFCRDDADTSYILPEILAAPNVSRFLLPPLGALSGESLNQPDRFLPAADAWQRALEDSRIDVFHATTPYRLDDLVPPRHDACPLVATHYDLIPLLYPAHYFAAAAGPGPRRWYERALRVARGAERLIAISEHVRREAMTHLGVPGERIVVAYPVAEPWLRRLPEGERERLLAPLRERLGIAGGFLLTVSHLHHAKNLRTLLDAYSGLAPELRRAAPLVLAGNLDAAETAVVRAWSRERGIEDRELALAGYLADEELAALYSAATVYVHPSRYEGFGLPVLEAMHCGAAVVAGNASALPEVVGDAGLLCDPEDAADMARAVTRLLRDPGLRRDLGEQALERAAAFRGEDLGRATLGAYEAASRRPPPNRRASRLALWTPVPPQRSGVADYSAELLRQLVTASEVEVFADDGVDPADELFELAPIHHFGEFARRAARRPFDAVLYQLGASFFHLYMIDALARWPGIVTLHDLTWGSLLYRAAALGGELDGFRRELAASDGEGAAAALRRAEEGPAAELGERIEELLNQYPVLRRIAAASLAQIVHMPRAAEELRERYPEAEPFAFPMGVEDPWQSRLPAAGDENGEEIDGAGGVRARYGLPADAFLIGLFGVADPVKRLESTVRALARLAPDLPAAVAVIVGSFYDVAYRDRLRRLAADLGVAARVVFAGRVPRRDFDRLLVAVDVVVNLRFPFRKQMSATLMRAIAAGRPVIVTDVPEWRFLPDAFCLRVAPDALEDEVLAAHLLRLARDPARRAMMSQAARGYYLEQATTRQMAAGYRRVIAEVTRGAR